MDDGKSVFVVSKTSCVDLHLAKILCFALTHGNQQTATDWVNRPVSCKLEYLRNINDRQLTVVAHNYGCKTSCCCLETLKCKETYGTRNKYCHGCSNHTEFLNYKHGTMKYNS